MITPHQNRAPPREFARVVGLLVGHGRPWWTRALIPLVLVGLAVLVRERFLGGLGRGTAYITFYPAVMFAALYGGATSGVCATVLGAALAFFWVQNGTLSRPELFAFGVFTVTSLFVSALSELLHRTVALLRTETGDRAGAESALRDSEIRAHAILSNLHDAVLLTRPDGTVLSANPAACRLFGRTEEEICRLGRAGLVDGTDPRLAPLLAERASHGRARGALTLLHRDGTRFEGECTSSLFTDAGGTVCTSMVIRDLTAQQLATTRLAQANLEWQSTFDASRDALWVLDRQHRIVRANRAAETLFGHAATAMAGHHCWEIAHGSAEPIPGCPLARAMHSLQRETAEIQRGDRWLEVVVDPILDAAGHYAGAVHGVSDITARRLAEQERNLLADTIGASRNEIYIFDAATLRFRYANTGAVANLGYTLEQLHSLTPLDIKPELTPGSFAALLDPLRRGEKSLQVFETVHRRADGSRYPVEAHLQLLQQDHHPIFLAVINDITARRRLEQELRESQEHYRLIAENTADIVWLFDLSAMRFVYVSPSVEQVRGFTREEAIVQPLEETLTPESCRFVGENLRQRLAAFAAGDPAARTCTYEFSLRHKAGHIVPAEVVTTILAGPDGRPNRVVGITRDLTERRRTEQALRESEEKFSKVFRYAPVFIAITDLETGRYLDLNDQFAQAAGYSRAAMLGHSGVELGWFSPEQRARLVAEIRAHDRVQNLEVVLQPRQGPPVIGLTSGEKITLAGRACLLTVTTDITARKTAEAELRTHTARLQSLLRIAEHREETEQEFLDRALAEALAITDSRLGYIYHYEEDQRRFVLNSWSKEVMAACGVVDPQTCYELDRTGIWGEAVRQRRPIVLNDFAAAHPLKHGYPEGHVALTRFLTIPVFDGERIVAVVGVANKPADYGEPDILQLQLLMGSVWRSVERRRSALALRESERFARSTIDALSAHLCVLDERGTILAVNQAWRTFAEANPPSPRHTHPGANYLAICDAATGPELAEARAFAAGIRAVLRGEQATYTLEYACHSPAEQRWFVGRVSRFPGAGLLRLVVVHENITERKLAENAIRVAQTDLERLVRERTAALAETNRLLARTSHLAQVGGWEVDLRTGTNTWSGATREIHEVDEAFVPNLENSLGFYAEASRPAIAAAVQTLAADGTPFDLELPFVTARGRRLWVRAIGEAFREHGAIVKIGGTFQDITERRQAEDELRRHRDHLEELVTGRTADLRASEERFRRAVIHSPFPVMLHAEDGAIIQVSNSWCLITGYAREEFSSMAEWTALAYGERRRQIADHIASTFALEGPVAEGDYRIRTKAGGLRVWDFSSAPLGHLPDGRRLVISMAIDVTERRRAEEEVRTIATELERRVDDRTRELTAANERLRELDRLKSEFLSTMSHELRTPLNSIVGFTGILIKGLAGPLNPEQHKQLGLVQSSGRHLLALINDLLDLSRIESGHMELQREEFDFAAVLDEVVASLRPTAEQKAIELGARCRPPAIRLVGDRRRTFQILLNLANNAVKFTEKGGVAIAAHTEAGRLAVAVRDTGIGIRPDQLPLLFEAFRQLDSSHRRHYEGTGLGLHLCKKLLDLLGGEISVVSEPGVGSTFTFTLPLPPATAEASGEPSP